MGLLSFLKGAGARIFGKKKGETDAEKATVLLEHIKSFGFKTENLKVSVIDELVILSGTVDTNENKNKILVTAGNVEGISKVEDHLSVWPANASEPIPPPEQPELEKQFYTVVPGDTLSKIARKYYGNANKYPVIFEANTPMLKHPDKIYPGQVLVIPPIE